MIATIARKLKRNKCILYGHDYRGKLVYLPMTGKVYKQNRCDRCGHEQEVLAPSHEGAVDVDQ